MKLGFRPVAWIVTYLTMMGLCLPLSGEMVDREVCSGRLTAEQIRSQADAIEGGDQGLPRTYEELTRLPLQLRKEVFRRLSLETQVAIWRSHLNSFLDQDLTTEQRATLVGFIDALSPEVFAALNEERVGETPFMEKLNAMAKVFDREQLINMTVRLGKGGYSGGPCNASADTVQCDCAQSWHGECLTWSYCGNRDCEETVRGCGPLWQQECNGTCCLIFRPCGVR
jgi:hypothetical protein